MGNIGVNRFLAHSAIGLSFFEKSISKGLRSAHFVKSDHFKAGTNIDFESSERMVLAEMILDL